ncbi:MAG: hypothetical protein M3Z98_11215, partial [Candidatus Dormibacteraeota bacterium]|nr:hypothetical protein [Candidatus Dormibacteraeota bacterium]
TATSNTARGMSGGAVYDDSGFASTTGSTYTNITMAGNHAFNRGGGMYVANGRVTVTNATVTANTVDNTNLDNSFVGFGGGFALGRSGTLTVNNGTVNANTATRAGGGVGVVDGFDTVTLHNTIVYGNSGSGATNNCAIRSGSSGAVITSTGYNLANDLTCFLTATGDRQGSAFNPNLGVLQDNGGPAQGAPGFTSQVLTEALPGTSIAVDTADPTTAKNPATDERHVTRPQGAASDVGAFEFVPVIPTLPLAGGHEAVGWRVEFALLAILLATLVAAMLVTVGRLSRAPADHSEGT